MPLPMESGVLLGFALLLLGPSPASSDAPALPTQSATVVFGGDVVPHVDLLASFAAHGPGSLFAPVASVIRGADLALVNLETPVSPGHPLTQSPVRFNV